MEEQLSLLLDPWSFRWEEYNALGIAYVIRWDHLEGNDCGGSDLGWVNSKSKTACIRYDGTKGNGQFIDGSPFSSYEAAIETIDKLVAKGIKEKKFINWHLKKVR